jgi:hypothetical protein
MWVSSDLATSLVYWENPRESGIACGSVLVCLLAVRYISLIRNGRADEMPGMPPSWKIVFVYYITNQYDPAVMPEMPPSWKSIFVNYIPNQE